MAELHDILVRPLQNERAAELESRNGYIFEVALGANKHQIREAVERFFGVKVVDVRTVVVRGKYRRQGRAVTRRPHWKKAYVQLAEGNTLNFA